MKRSIIRKLQRKIQITHLRDYIAFGLKTTQRTYLKFNNPKMKSDSGNKRLRLNANYALFLGAGDSCLAITLITFAAQARARSYTIVASGVDLKTPSNRFPGSSRFYFAVSE